jgi:hypothetical protein
MGGCTQRPRARAASPGSPAPGAPPRALQPARGPVSATLHLHVRFLIDPEIFDGVSVPLVRSRLRITSPFQGLQPQQDGAVACCFTSLPLPPLGTICCQSHLSRIFWDPASSWGVQSAVLCSSARLLEQTGTPGGIPTGFHRIRQRIPFRQRTFKAYIHARTSLFTCNACAMSNTGGRQLPMS